jgi:hypothetical protein
MEPTTIDHDTTAAVIPSSASQVSPEGLEQVLIGGDLSRLTETQRLAYYRAVCQRLGRNLLSKPFEYLALNGKPRLYALRDCTDQLRRLRGISIYITNRERLQDLYMGCSRTPAASSSLLSYGLCVAGERPMELFSQQPA